MDGLCRLGVPRIGRVKVLLTNDDGIGASGLHALRRALLEIDGLDVHVVAPHTNRSGTARSITTRSPIWVEEVTFDDGESGFATEGTPVDCVRFADLGLLGEERPDLIVSGINHGSNLGDDVTYSGTVAAAFEGIVLGIPAIAVSQQAGIGGMGYAGREFDFTASATVAREVVARLVDNPLPDGTLLNINCPAGEATGIEVTRLGKRLYDDELKLVEEADGRRRYQIYGFEPSHEDQEGTDLSAVAEGRVAITPIHFDLTDHGALEQLAGWDLDAIARSIGVPASG
jgi:5'-nucleotidase